MSDSPAWVTAFKEQLDGHEKDQAYTTYALATLDAEGNPKVRHVIHRFLTPASNLLITTTDTRMAKPAHLRTHHTVECAWWIEPTAVQMRITGEAYTIPIPNVPGAGAEGYEAELQDALKGLRAVGSESTAEYWEGERKRLWKEAMSGHLRASFARPQPGKPLDEVSSPEEWATRLDAESDDPKEQQKIDEALSHFALLAIRPVAVEVLELKPVPNKRTQWAEKGAEWVERRVAP